METEIKEVNELLKIKREGTENGELINLDAGKLDSIIKELFDKLDKAYLNSKIPEIPEEEDVEELNKYLVSLR